LLLRQDRLRVTLFVDQPPRQGGRYALWSFRSEGGSASRSGDGFNVDDQAEMRTSSPRG